MSSRVAAMESSSLIKLLILLLMTFIMCLPELFPQYQDQGRIDLTCMGFQPCLKQRHRDLVCPPNTEDTGHRNECLGCTNSSIMGGSPGITSGSTNGSDSPGTGWFRCETTADLGALKWTGADLELSVLQSGEHKLHNATLVGCVDSCGIRHPLICCVEEPASSLNHSQCILCARGFENASINVTLLWTYTQHGFFWSCSYRLLWLATVMTVILLVISTTIRHILKNRFCKRRPAVLPITAYQLSPALSGPAACPDGKLSQNTACKQLAQISPLTRASSPADIRQRLC
ncbi:uncharacterized protein LOC125720574 isoform X2 [Brienomyrus brachyistius]|uniref:uncharacterized protein LOC125720574 isoform X2 n=1 Tax=Brienomyrus brachyistius TaxID=42636 RepID=UPI0020B1DB22|nr:uncharacterized protein LOC125720574 isoform X2 [Brienomyrus brachyistius]